MSGVILVEQNMHLDKENEGMARLSDFFRTIRGTRLCGHCSVGGYCWGTSRGGVDSKVPKSTRQVFSMKIMFDLQSRWRYPVLVFWCFGWFLRDGWPFCAFSSLAWFK